MDIIELLKQPEGKTLEFKRDLSSTVNLLRSVVAFANTAGGRLLIGVEDKSHYICGIDDPLSAEERLTNLIADNIVPRIIPDIDILPWRDSYLLVVNIFPSSTRPHYYKKYGRDEGVFIRVGSSNRRADQTMIEELKRIAQNVSFDEQAMPELKVESIDFNAILDQFEEVKSVTKKDLESLSLITTCQGKKVATIAGTLLFGKHREKYFPDAWIQAGRFRGVNKNYIDDSVAFHSYPTIAIDEVMEFIEKHATQSIEIKRTKHVRRWSIPHAAVREAVINAVVHADYSQQGSPIRVAVFDDRIEITNPGLLKFGLTISDIKQGMSKLRNRIIGRVFNLIGLIEQWGSGIGRIIETAREGGFPEPKFEELATHFRVTIYTNRKQPSRLDDTNQKIVILLKKNIDKGLTTQDVAKHIKLSARTARTRLLKLIELGLVVEMASSPQDPHKKYFLSD